ncbi:MAG: hypothetical protein GX601_05230 [Anaerolineales bacterium]|nr:hypothetical protein [Anaerolineales bacterium]
MEDDGVEVVASSDNFSVWQMEDEDGEITYHLETGAVTLHFYREEWQELLALLKGL